MKKIYMLIALSVIANSALAASPDVINAVLSEVRSSIPDINKIEVTKTFRCRSCYEVTITGTTPIGDASAVLSTRHTADGIVAKMISGTR